MPIPLGILAVAGAGAAGGGAFDLLETNILSTTAASLTFSNLNTYSDYKHLQIRSVNRTDRSGSNSSDMALRFNGDEGSNYYNHSLYGDGSTVASLGSANLQINIALTSGANEIANVFGAFVVDILDFSSSSKNTTIRSLSGKEGNDDRVNLTSGVWLNTAAVTSITIRPRFGNFIANSRFSLYGIK